jgi:hypothetical protein
MQMQAQKIDHTHHIDVSMQRIGPSKTITAASDRTRTIYPIAGSRAINVYYLRSA